MAKQVIVTVSQYSRVSGMVKQRITGMLRKGEMPPGIVSAFKDDGAKCAWLLVAKTGWEKKIRLLLPYQRLS